MDGENYIFVPFLLLEGLLHIVSYSAGHRFYYEFANYPSTVSRRVDACTSTNPTIKKANSKSCHSVSGVDDDIDHHSSS